MKLGKDGVVRAAIYARKSTEQRGVSEESKSVTRQIEKARTFAASRGWTTDDAMVFVDDGISGAEFEKRLGLQRLLAQLKPVPKFSVLIVSEQKSLGRELAETLYRIKQLAKAGVEIFEYVHGQSLTPKNAMEKLLSSVRGYSDEDHREKTRERVHEAHTHKAERGYCVGGRVFGYRNEDVFADGLDDHGRPKRSHVVRKINREQAAVIVKIFTLYADGLGLKAIAQRLNLEDAPSPKPFIRRDPTKVGPLKAWAPATIRAILMRELYRGVMVYNRSRKRDDWGQVNQKQRPESEWIRVNVPQLRIVSEELWARVASRRADTEGKTVRFAGGRLSGRPPKEATVNLLAGLATCACCGGGLVVETSARKRGRIKEYVCFRRRSHGECTNTLRMPMDTLDEAVLTAIEEHVLTADAVEQVILLSERDDHSEKQVILDREHKSNAKKITRLLEAIEQGGGSVSAVIEKLRALEARQREIETERTTMQPVPRLPKKVVDDRLAEWRRLLRSSTTQARAVLQRVIVGRIVFTPTTEDRPVKNGVAAPGYRFETQTRFDKLFAGVASVRPGWMKDYEGGPTSGITAEDTVDADYGRLLERAYVKGLASPTGFEPVF
jgi:site-specific DNA recombinase